MKNPLFIVLAVFIALTGYFVYRTNSQNNPPASGSQEREAANFKIEPKETVFFWGQGCSHCENVEKFFTENGNLDQKLNIKKIEVFQNKEARKLFADKIKECGLDSLGVPMLYKGGKCLQGDAPIIEELKKGL